MHSFSNFRHCEWDDHYRVHGNRDNDREFRIGTALDANNVETAVAADGESPYLFVLALLLAVSMVAARHSSRRLLPISVLLIVSLMWIASCGGGGSSGSGGGNPGTPSGTVTITGTSSGVNHSVSLNLTVN